MVLSDIFLSVISSPPEVSPDNSAPRLIARNSISKHHLSIQDSIQSSINGSNILEAHHFAQDTLLAEEKTPAKSDLISVGIQVNNRPVVDSIQVRGKEDGEQAIDFEQWLVPLEQVAVALKLNVKTLEAEGQLELRGKGLLTRISLKDLVTDPDLGLAISIANLQRLLGIAVTFDPASYSIVFKNNWSVGNRQVYSSSQSSSNLDQLSGIPQVAPSPIGIAAISQSFTLSGFAPRNGMNRTNTSGSLTAVGTIGGGSWFTSLNQPNFFAPRTWSLNEAQYFRPTEFTDYVIGSQPTFWQSQTGQQYWGLTVLNRSGFSAPSAASSGFIPQERLASKVVNRVIRGEAAPGTLVQLTRGSADEVVTEMLVDASGTYRFEALPFAVNSATSGNYRLRLFANGRLSTTPEIREVQFSNLSGQLSQGSSAWIFSTGINRYQGNNSFTGEFRNLLAGAEYRFGATESLTLGAGLVYDQSLQGYGEAFFQPTEIPVQASFSGLFGGSKGLQYSADLVYRPAAQWEMRIGADNFLQSFQMDWRNALPGIGLRLGGNSRAGNLFAGTTIQSSLGRLLTYADFSIDTNYVARWRINSSLGNWKLSHQGGERFTDSKLIHNIAPNQSVQLSYETQNTGDALTSLSWNYRSDSRNANGNALWETELGYGIGSRGQGWMATATTNWIPGLSVRLRYESISVLSDSSSFRLEISSGLLFSPQLVPSNSDLTRFRNQGTILLQPFYDANNNDRIDPDEAIYQEDHGSLFSIDDQPLVGFYPVTSSDGSLLRINPGRYRVDLDPSGYPMGWIPSNSSYAVTVVPGGNTLVQIPMKKSFTVMGVVRNQAGEAVGGLKVEARANNTNRKYLSVTDGSGTYTLDGLTTGTYDMTINGQPAIPGSIAIDDRQETTQELDLKLPAKPLP